MYVRSIEKIIFFQNEENVRRSFICVCNKFNLLSSFFLFFICYVTALCNPALLFYKHSCDFFFLVCRMLNVYTHTATDPVWSLFLEPFLLTFLIFHLLIPMVSPPVVISQTFLCCIYVQSKKSNFLLEPFENFFFITFSSDSRFFLLFLF